MKRFHLPLVALCGALLMISGCAQPASAPMPTATPPVPTPAPDATATLLAPSATPSLDPLACAESTGQVIETSFESARLGRSVSLRLYLPPCHSTRSLRYPLLILLHGWMPDSREMNADQWDRLGVDEAANAGISAGSLPPMIIALPDTNDMGQDRDDSPIAQVLAEELVPLLEAQYCAWDTREGHAIGGLSRGGFWAFSTAIQYPWLFSRAGGHSPFLYKGDPAAGDYVALNPSNLIETASGLENLPFYIDYGAQDYAGPGAAEFADLLSLRRLPLELIQRPEGSHVEAYWAAHLTEYLAWYAQTWPLDLTLYPACG